ncbi:MAG TPA: DnaJ domain-containing protein [Blastocatellia bacterium]|nr:DnaJ domain-containing protein [Blastocatellia bacterium]
MNKYDSNKDYYEMLGIDSGATKEEIDKAFRNEARKKHPDGGGSEEEMKSLNEAHDVLSDTATREAYDSEREPPPRASYGSSMAFDPEAASRAGTLNIPVADEDYAGLIMGAATCFGIALPLLGLIEMQWVFFLWPLRVLSIGALGLGVVLAHSALSLRNRRTRKKRPDYPHGRFVIYEAAFWMATGFLAFLLYLLLYSS